MHADPFVTVFDAATAGFKDWDFSASGLIMVAIGLAILLAPRLIRATGIPFLDFGSRWLKVFPFLFIGFALFWSATSFMATYTPYLRHQALLRDKGCSVVEGAIEHFVPMPYTGHGEESFSVSGVEFSYSDYSVSDAFNTTASHGGPVRAGQTVRICYDPSDHAILRLAIRDFKGAIPDYSKSMDFAPPPVPTAADRSKDENDGPPWFANLFVLFWLLDFFACLALYTRYLRTFIRVKTVSASAAVSPALLSKSGTTKLRNSLVRPDAANSAIWLRPRGFNVFLIPLMVAKLNLDAIGTSVAGYEIRFSSGFPVVMILFFSTAYVMFSGSGLGAQGAAAFLGVVAIMFLLFGGIRLVRNRKRMQTLVEEALAELKDAV